MKNFMFMLTLAIGLGIVLSISTGQAATPQVATPMQQPQLSHRIFAPSIVQSTSNPPTPLAIQLHVNERLSWYAPAQQHRNTNIIVVMDYSGSMRNCVNTQNQCSLGSRLFDYGVAPVRTLVKELLVDQAAEGADHQMAYVAFGIIRDNLHTAEIQVPLTTTATLFHERIGSAELPRTIPNTDLVGWTSTPAGLKLAAEILTNARTVDKDGNPVTNVVILISEGSPNVLIDTPYEGRVNNETGPFGASTPPSQRGPDWQPCARYAGAAYNIFYQMLCPLNHPTVRSPIQATIDYGNFLHANNAKIWILPLGREFDVKGELASLLADSRLAVTNDPAQSFQPVLTDLAGSCTVITEASRPAVGANVSLYDANQQLITQAVVETDGSVALPALTQGQYYLSASHLDVIAPNDPYQLTRDYSNQWLLPVQSEATALQSFTVGPDQPTQMEAILVPAEPVQCP